MNEKMLVRFDHYHDEWAVQYKDVVSRMISWNKVIFKKSSYCAEASGDKCVGVSISKDAVLVTETDRRWPALRFTKDEWKEFVKGVKNGEFDLG